MKTAIAFVIFVAVFVLLAVIISEQNRDVTLPLVQVHACPKLSNPCDKVNCHRTNPKEIA